MNRKPRYIYVSNIPKIYHACHLRNFYSQFVESSAFVCFHFRHRPQPIIPSNESPIRSSIIVSAIQSRCNRDKSVHCAFLSISSEEHDQFCRQYNQTHWLSPDNDESPMAEQCILTPIEFDRESDQDVLLQLIEFKPPVEMPQGNVGTPSQYFFAQIQACRLDPTMITKLQLNFSSIGRNRKYGAVPYSYEPQNLSTLNYTENEPIYNGDVRSRSGKPILDAAGYADYVDTRIDPADLSPIRTTEDNNNAEDMDEPNEDLPQPNEDEPCEDWERFEALHDDPYKTTRSDKANLKYEDKVELVWEKGSSGLVFHTDERTWRKLDPLRKEEPFDEPASLDWDVDMEPYEQSSELPTGPTPTGHWGSARDTCDLIDIQRAREQIDLPKPGLDPSGTFHEQTCDKGYGQCLLKRMGWKPGTRLGPVNVKQSITRRGLLSPLELDEHTLAPRVRTGLGYYGPPCLDYSILPGQSAYGTSTVYIRSVFDSPETVAQRSGLGLSKSLLRRDDPQLVLKYRHQPDQKPEQSAPTSASQMTPRNRTVILNSYGILSKEGITFVHGGFLHPSTVTSTRH